MAERDEVTQLLAQIRAGDEQASARLDRRELALEPDDERVHAGVGRKQVGAEPDRPHGHTLLVGPRQGLLEIRHRAGAGETACGAADPDGRHLRESDTLLDLHTASSDESALGRLWERPTSPSHGASLSAENARVGVGSALGM